MRPGDFSPGNKVLNLSSRRVKMSFNEAGGFLPRKRYPLGSILSRGRELQ